MLKGALYKRNIRLWSNIGTEMPNRLNNNWPVNFLFCSCINVLHDCGLSLAGLIEQQKLLIMLSIKRHDLSFFDVRIIQRAFQYEKKSHVITAM